uniref:prickle-like protein 4 isoform X2 n=1 Tax=Jaculus jaculus TaxID=51337 RepID=UPI001E1B5308|nr:prickle-like protein 4 isoform X2 [Jaculus jaculus]
MSVLKSGWPRPHQDSRVSRGSGPPVNSDSDSGHGPVDDPEEDSGQAAPAALSLGPPPLDPNWPGLQRLLQQLPPQDSDERYCLDLEEGELDELRLFCALRKQKALGQGVARLPPAKLEGHACEKCGEQLKPGEYGVFAARAGERRCWHRSCFACQACGQTLISLIYFYHDGHLYCGRHHAELLRPRCPACDQLIFSPRCTEAEGRSWHENHFCCQDCAGPLGGGRYALPGGSPCCSSCFESRYRSAGSSSSGAREGRAPLGEAGPERTEGSDSASLQDESPSSPAALPAALARSSVESPRGPSTGAPQDPTQKGPCSSSSSSSDSEPEGFFFGQRLPRPGETPGHLRAEARDTSRKHCTVC